MAWTFSKSRKVYKNEDTGQELKPADLRSIRDRLADGAQNLAREAARRLNDAEISNASFVKSLSDISARVITASAMLGRGGEAAMTTADWSRTAEAIQVNDGHLDDWAGTGGLSESNGEDGAGRELADESDAQVEARAAQYANGGISSYGESQAALYGVDLPATPGDGQTECGNNCRCHLLFEDQDDGSLEITWETEEDGNVCEDCQAMGDEWNPLTIDAPEAGDAGDQG